MRGRRRISPARIVPVRERPHRTPGWASQARWSPTGWRSCSLGWASASPCSPTGGLIGEFDGSLCDCLYYAAVCYTSLSLGDIVRGDDRPELGAGPPADVEVPVEVQRPLRLEAGIRQVLGRPFLGCLGVGRGGLGCSGLGELPGLTPLRTEVAQLAIVRSSAGIESCIRLHSLAFPRTTDRKRCDGRRLPPCSICAALCPPARGAWPGEWVHRFHRDALRDRERCGGAGDKVAQRVRVDGSQQVAAPAGPCDAPRGRE